MCASGGMRFPQEAFSRPLCQSRELANMAAFPGPATQDPSALCQHLRQAPPPYMRLMEYPGQP